MRPIRTALPDDWLQGTLARGRLAAPSPAWPSDGVPQGPVARALAPFATEESVVHDGPTRMSAVAPPRPPTVAEVATAPVSLPDRRTSNDSKPCAAQSASPQDALYRHESFSARTYTRLAILTGVIGLVMLPLLGGEPLPKAIAFAAVASWIGVSAWFHWRLREPDGYTIRRSFVSAVANLVAGLAFIYFFGIFSPVVVLMPAPLYYFSLKKSDRATLAIFAGVAGGYLLIASAVLAGVLPDWGMLTPLGAALRDKLACVIVVELTLAHAFLLSRTTRSTVRAAIEFHEQAVRDVARRESLLAEARRDLERALQVGGLGRFTDTAMGSFVLGRVIGRGAMGEVYEARDRRSGRLAAVKMLHARVLDDPQAVRRFLREARTIASLRTRHVVRVLEVGGHDAPFPYIAMERLRGKTLGDLLLQRGGRLPLADVARLVREVGRGLDVLRAAGIVHRDIKPRNLFRAEEEDEKSVWKILDLGVSKSPHPHDTQTEDALVGTPAFMAPEQASQSPVTYRTDLFALAAVAYRALTGRSPFDGETVPQILHQVVHVHPPAPSRLANLPAELDFVFAIGLAKEPAERFDSASELADALDAAGSGYLREPLRRRGKQLLAVA